MDGQRFDMLTRALRSRRGALGTLVGGLTALVGLATRFEAAEAKCVNPGRRCKKQGRKLRCCGGAKCRGGTCRCNASDVAIRGKCEPKIGTCQGGEDTCSGQIVTCNPDAPVSDCYCVQTLANQTRCARIIAPMPCGCTSDAECRGRVHEFTGKPLGKDAFCIQNTPGNCGGSCDQTSMCVIPCRAF